MEQRQLKVGETLGTTKAGMATFLGTGMLAAAAYTYGPPGALMDQENAQLLRLENANLALSGVEQSKQTVHQEQLPAGLKSQVDAFFDKKITKAEHQVFVASANHPSEARAQALFLGDITVATTVAFLGVVILTRFKNRKRSVFFSLSNT